MMKQVKKSNKTLVLFQFLDMFLVNWPVLEEVDRACALPAKCQSRLFRSSLGVVESRLKGSAEDMRYSLYLRGKTGNCRYSALHLTIWSGSERDAACVFRCVVREGACADETTC